MTDDKTTPDDEAEVVDAPETPEAEASGDEAAPTADAAPEAADEAPSESESEPTPEPVAAAPTPEERLRAERVEARASGDAQPVRAVAKYLRFSAQKGRLVVDQIRGKRVLDAATALAFSDRDAAREVMKVLKSAVANAEHNNGMRPDELYVSHAFVDEGPTFKRWKPRARGRVDRIQKRTCHITIVVDQAPAALLEGRSAARAAASKGDRSARVAGSKKPAAKKSAAKKSTKKTASEATA
jgi:large subunit ribosomal protein L22